MVGGGSNAIGGVWKGLDVQKIRLPNVWISIFDLILSPGRGNSGSPGATRVGSTKSQKSQKTVVEDSSKYTERPKRDIS